MAIDPSLEFEIIFPQNLWERLRAHLFRTDDDEHGAVVAAGLALTSSRARLLVRHVFLAQDGTDYVAGQRGYRMLTPDFVRDHILLCRDEKLAYLAVHNHGGRDEVAFSLDDLRSHERGYPALRDISRGQVVGGLVFAENAVAGDLWIGDRRASLKRARIVGTTTRELFPQLPPSPPKAGPEYDRQARVFGDRGQAMLGRQRVGVIGLGGVGSLVTQYLVKLGVGALVLVDPDKVEITNVPRLAGCSEADVGHFKVDVAAREALRVRPNVQITRLADSVVDDHAARALTSCDYLFLAADSMQARLVFNALVHQYFIPGIQLGAKVPVDRVTGAVEQIFTVVRPLTPGRNCLWCNELIPPAKLQEEALSAQERKAQRYVEDDDIPSPSVITLNAVVAAHGVNDYLLRVTGLRQVAEDDYAFFEPRNEVLRKVEARRDEQCLECGSNSQSRFGRGDGRDLPTRPAKPSGR